MQATISTHNGSSFSLGHNRRDPKYTSKVKHIDLERKHENWIDMPIKDAYTHLFSEAVREYNKKQTREDRKIDDYYRKIQADKRKHVAYEMIIAIGSRENPVQEEDGYKIMKEYVENWKERNPNLFLYGAYYHADEEGIPHVHCDYIPVADNFKRGMKTQTALTKALEQQGFEHKGNKATCQIQWEKSENQYLEGLCSGYGIQIIHPMAGKGVEHVHYTTYKAKKELEEVQKELDQVKKNLKQGKKETKRIEKRLSDTTTQLQMNEVCVAETEEEIDANIKQIGSSKKELQELQDKKAEIKEEVSNLEELQGLSAAMVQNPQQIKKVPFRNSVIVDGATAEQVQDAFDVVATMQGILDRQRMAEEELEEREKKLKAFEKSLKKREALINDREKQYEEDVAAEICIAKQEQKEKLVEKFKNILNEKIRETWEKAQKTINNLKEKLANALEMNNFLRDKLEEHGIYLSAYDYTVWSMKNDHPAEQHHRDEREYDDFER